MLFVQPIFSHTIINLISYPLKRLHFLKYYIFCLLPADVCSCLVTYIGIVYKKHENIAHRDTSKGTDWS